MSSEDKALAPSSSKDASRSFDEDWMRVRDPRRRLLLREFCDASSSGDVASLRRLSSLSDSEFLQQPDPDDHYGWTALHYAAFKGQVAAISFLIGTADLETDARDKSDRTALHVAVASGRIDAAEMLLKFGADVDAKDKQQWAPLHIAVFRLNVEMVKFLVETVGADVNAKCSVGTAMELAGSHKEITAILEQARKTMSYRS